MISDFIQACEDILHHEVFLSSHEFIHHSDVSCRDHMIFVAFICYKIHKKINVPLKPLMRSALLHDLYLYDWHVGHPDSKGYIKLHGLFHPKRAYEEAIKHFSLSSVEKNAIVSHMWPLTPMSLPTSKVAWTLCLVDKYCATIETLSPKKRLWLKSLTQKIYSKNT